MPVLPIVDALPEDYLRLIGEIVTAWAVQEHELRLTTFALLGVGPKQGRIAVRSTRAKDTLDMIADLMSLSGLVSSTTNLPELGKLLDEIENRRNTLAHNVWLRTPEGEFLVQSLSGTWPKSSSAKGAKRRMHPAGLPVTTEALADLLRTIRDTIGQSRVLRQELSSLVAKSTEAGDENDA
jgi:hypothetical protein